jgi:peptidoglycan/LPS O-acetylase OafA/YrhL
MIPAANMHRAPFPADMPALTSMRAFLALGVAMFHYQLAWTLTPAGAGLFNRSRLGVDVFFMLSGFILTHVYLATGRNWTWRSFITARMARVLPLHLFILAGMVGLVLGARIVGVGLEPGRFNLPDFVSTLTLTHAWFPRTTMVLWNGPSWSLSAEWFAYLAFPAFAWVGLGLRDRPGLLVGLSALLFVAIDAVYSAATGLILPRAEDNAGIVRIIPEFLMGMGLYFLGGRLKPGRRTAATLAIVSTAALVLAMQAGIDDRLIVALGAPFLLSVAMASRAGADGVMGLPALQFAGRVSFAFYLSHIPVLMVWRNAVEAVFHLPGDYLMGPWEVLALLGVSAGIATLLHLYVEVPAQSLWLRRSRPSLAGSADRLVGGRS